MKIKEEEDKALLILAYLDFCQKWELESASVAKSVINAVEKL